MAEEQHPCLECGHSMRSEQIKGRKYYWCDVCNFGTDLARAKRREREQEVSRDHL